MVEKFIREDVEKSHFNNEMEFRKRSNIILIGFMGAGKSLVAKELSLLTSMQVIEMDQLILKRHGVSSMHELFQKGGELLLRESEIALAKELRSVKGKIISTGGGVVMNKIILDYLPGTVVHLFTPFEELKKRLVNDTTRPLFSPLSSKELYYFRLPLYHKYAAFTIDTTSLTPKEVAKSIITYFPKNQQL